MRRKGKRTKGIEQAQPFAGLSKVNPHAAGVDTSTSSVQALGRKKSWCV